MTNCDIIMDELDDFYDAPIDGDTDAIAELQIELDTLNDK